MTSTKIVHCACLKQYLWNDGQTAAKGVAYIKLFLLQSRLAEALTNQALKLDKHGMYSTFEVWLTIISSMSKYNKTMLGCITYVKSCGV